MLIYISANDNECSVNIVNSTHTTARSRLLVSYTLIPGDYKEHMCYWKLPLAHSILE